MSNVTNTRGNGIKDGKPPVGRRYILRLFVSGMLQNSILAINNIKTICETHLRDKHELEIIDIYEHPDLARSEQIIAVPVLILKQPLPERRIIGDLSDTEMVLSILNINSK